MPNAIIPVNAVTVIGATAFSQARLLGIASSISHRNVPLSQIEAVRLQLLGLYRGQGYVLSTVSMDIDAQGNVRFIVREGRIVEVLLSGDIGPAGTLVLAFLSHLTQERPVREASLERWLLLAQQIPGVTVHAVLQANGEDPGALTLVAEVSRQVVSALATVDNRAFELTGPAEGLLVGDLNSFTSLGEQTEVSLYHTSHSTNNFGQASESFFLGSNGLRLKLYGGSGRAHPGGSLGASGYESVVTIFGGQLSYPVILRRNQALTLYGRFDAIENDISALGALASTDQLRVARGDTQYAWEDLMAGESRDALNVVDVQLSKGLPILGASADGRAAPPAGRASQRIDFWKITGSVQRTQTLFSPFPAASLDLHLAAGGQYTPLILPTEEEFSLGGPQFTRGYYSGEVVGDKSAYATAELQLNTGADFNLLQQTVDLGAQFYAFYDWGEAWANLHSDAGHKVSSLGCGVRVALTKYLEVDGEFVHRLTTQLAPSGTGVRPLDEDAGYWSVTARY